MKNKIEETKPLEPYRSYCEDDSKYISFDLEEILNKNQNQGIDFIVNNLILALETYTSGAISFYSDCTYFACSLFYNDNKYFLQWNDYAQSSGMSEEIKKEEAIEKLKLEIIKIQNLK